MDDVDILWQAIIWTLVWALIHKDSIERICLNKYFTKNILYSLFKIALYNHKTIHVDMKFANPIMKWVLPAQANQETAGLSCLTDGMYTVIG